MIVLHEIIANTGFRQPALMITFEEESAGILVHVGADKNNARDFRLDYLQAAPPGGAQAVTVFRDLSRLL